MPPADSTAWERVGRLLAARRAQISPRYANRRTFAAERGMNWRTLHDIEHAKRDNFRPETMRAFETAYALVPGSLDRTLAGGELEPLPPGSAALRPVPAPVPLPAADPDFPEDDNDDAISQLIAGNDALEAIWRLRDADGKPYPREERIRLMRAHLEGMRARARRAERDTGT